MSGTIFGSAPSKRKSGACTPESGACERDHDDISQDEAVRCQAANAVVVAVTDRGGDDRGRADAQSHRDAEHDEGDRERKTHSGELNGAELTHEESVDNVEEEDRGDADDHWNGLGYEQTGNRPFGERAPVGHRR